ncbi:MAG: aa3-type cytochrome c oxidase subunit IV [Hyphomicrobiales bacterium]|nr:MAG: aa3-type cytochrome c oxidase subunit IV [Hyphomicrobiales bacterium]
MDYAEHERTYDRFIALIKLSVVALLNIVLTLVLVGFGGSMGGTLASLLLIATIVAAAIGLPFGHKGWIPSAFVFALGVVLIILTVA